MATSAKNRRRTQDRNGHVNENANGHVNDGFDGIAHGRRSADPDDQGDRGSLIFRFTQLLENVFSHKGMFWLGIGIATVSWIANVRFYWLLLMGGGLLGWQAGLGAVGISFGTCLFEVLPVIWGRSHRNTLNQIFAAGVKPDTLPTLNPMVVGNAEELVAAYRDSDRKSASFFQTMRWVAIAVESFLGVLFLGSVGTGTRGLLNLALFVGSIFGVEWGVSLSVRAGQWELPPKVRNQLNALLGNNDKPLDLIKLTK